MSRNIYFPGVVSGYSIAIGTHEGPRVIIRTIAPLVTDLLNLAEHWRLSTVWVAPGSILSQVDPEIFCDADESVWDIRYTQVAATSHRLARMKSVTAWRHEGTWEEKRKIEIIFPEQTSWEWEEEDPLTILQAIQTIQRNLAVTLDSHPGSTGRELMKWWVQKDLQLAPKIDLAQLPAKCGRDLAWKRPIWSMEEWGKGRPYYLHAYDKNGQRLSAAGGATLGIGDPQYYNQENMKPPDLRLAGLWRIQATLARKERIGDMAYPLSKFSWSLPWPVADDQEWVTTPLLKCLIEKGCHVQVFEGYEWPVSRQALAKWSAALWASVVTYRADESAVGQLCLYSMKRVYTSAIGLLGSERTPDSHMQWFRPDWWSTIIETAKARMLYNIHKFAEETGAFPCLVHVDALYYVSDSADPDPRFLTRSTELGGYKHKCSIPVDSDVVDWFSSEMNAGTVAGMVNEWAEKRANYV
jgi:hypothetical protein